MLLRLLKIPALTALIGLGCLGAEAAGDVSRPGFVTSRHVYPRGSECLLVFRAADAAAVRFDVSGWLPQTVSGRDGTYEYRIDTGQLRAGDYDVRAGCVRQGDVSETVVFPLTVGQPHNRERMQVWWMGGRGEDLDLVRARGFTGGLLPCIKAPIDAGTSLPDTLRVKQLLDRAACVDFSMGLYVYPLLSEQLTLREGAWGTLSNGKRAARVYPLAPPVREFARSTIESCMREFGEYPALRHVLMCSEYQTPKAHHPEAIRLAQQEMGLAEADNPLGFDLTRRRAVQSQNAEECADGLIPDGYPPYRFEKWWWERGHGTNAVNADMAPLVKAIRPDIVTWHEPYRSAPVRKSHTGLDMVVTWTYGHPDLRRLCYTTYLQAAARPEQQLVGHDISLFVYGRFAAPLVDATADSTHDSPGRDPFFTAGPDYAREATWLVFSQRPDVLMYYAATSLHFAKSTLDPRISSPETLDAIGETCRVLVEPYGPAVLDCVLVKPEVAVLASAAGAWFPAGKRPPGYRNELTVPFATLLLRNHVPFDVLLDDDVIEGRIDDYDVLVLPFSPTLTLALAERIRDFITRGGKVIANAPFRATLPGAIVTDYDLSCCYRVSGTRRGDMLTYGEYQRIMEQYAEQLRPHLTSVRRRASASTPRVVANSLDGGDVHYHFFVNDERVFGPRFGMHKLRPELGAPLTATLSVALDGRPVLYDVLRHKAVAYETHDGTAEFEATLPAARGMLVAALPEPIAAVRVSAPADACLGVPVTMRLEVLGESGRPFAASLPLRVDVVDPLGRRSEWCRYTTTRRGRRGTAQFVWTPAVNDVPGEWTVSVSDLVAGKRATVTLCVERR